MIILLMVMLVFIMMLLRVLDVRVTRVNLYMRLMVLIVVGMALLVVRIIFHKVVILMQVYMDNLLI